MNRHLMNKKIYRAINIKNALSIHAQRRKTEITKYFYQEELYYRKFSAYILTEGATGKSQEMLLWL